MTRKRYGIGPHVRRLRPEVLDGRTRLGREIRDTRRAIVAALGGEKALTPHQRLLVDRAVEKSVRCAMIFDRMVEDGDLAGESERRYIWYANSLRRDLTALGITKAVPGAAEDVPDLDDYLAAKGAPA